MVYGTMGGELMHKILRAQAKRSERHKTFQAERSTCYRKEAGGGDRGGDKGPIEVSSFSMLSLALRLTS